MRMQFQKRIIEGNNSDWIIVRIHYPRPNSIRVSVDGQSIRPIPILDESAEADLATQVGVCGANKYFYDNYTIHFVVTGDKDCLVVVQLTNNLQLTAHFQMKIDDFFSNGLETKFIDRMAALLGV